jgi:hypothetical protein
VGTLWRFEVATVVVVLVAVLGCGKGNDDGEDFGNLIASAQGTQLTRAEHPTGWGQKECFLCHPVDEIHKVDRSGTGTLPLEDIRRLVARDGLASCRLCHGDNGVDR